MENIKKNHLNIMRFFRKYYMKFLQNGIDLKKYYTNVIIGFDIIKFDEDLEQNINYNQELSLQENMINIFGKEIADDFKELVI